MVGAEFARDNFGSISQAIGQVIKSEGEARTIVGVLPDGFSFPDRTNVWVELKADPSIQDRSAYNQRAIGKLKPGVSAAALNAEMCIRDRAPAVRADAASPQKQGRILRCAQDDKP